MDNKFKYLFKNMGLLLIGNFSSKILVFLLVPLYTSVLSTSEYGSYDLIYSSIQMLLPILSLNIIDGVMRFSIGGSKEQQCITFTVGIKYIIFSCIAVLSIMLVFPYISHSNILGKYRYQIIFLYMAYALNQLFIQFARGIEDITGISIAGIVSTFVMIAGNIVFLLWFKLGLRGYFIANSLAFIISALFLFFRNKMYNYVLFFKSIGFDNSEKEIIKYSLPLIFTTLSWYVNGVSDRFVVTLFCGISLNGIYSIAYKIPSILNAIQTIFIQAWQLSAIREFQGKKTSEFYSTIYEGCYTIMIIICSGLIMFTRILANILFAKEFYMAWIYVPTLLIYIVFNTMSGVVGGVFSATKDTKSIANSAIVGASVNLVLNFIMVYLWGPEGAAIATVISSIVIWYMRMYYSKQHVQFNIDNKKHIIGYFLLVLQAALMTTITVPIGYCYQVIILISIILLNKNMILKIAGGMKK